MGNESSSRKHFSKKYFNCCFIKRSTTSTTIAPPPNGTLTNSNLGARPVMQTVPQIRRTNRSVSPKASIPSGGVGPTKAPSGNPEQSGTIGGAENGASESLPIVIQQLVASERKSKASLDDFVLLKMVGKGSLGRMIQVKKKDSNKIYTMKKLKKNQIIMKKQFEHTMAERRILEDIDHPFIVSLCFAFQTSSTLYMVFDFFNGVELFYCLSKNGRFSEERARLYAAEITLALEHVHNTNIIFRDLKPENLFLDADGHIRVTDFGLSKNEDQIESFYCTPEYLAPEVLKGHWYGKAVDWWSLGTLLYEMIAGFPFCCDQKRERILGAEAEMCLPSHLSAEAESICRGMLKSEPQQRLGYRGAQEVKAHPFFAPLNFDDLVQKKFDPPFKPTMTDEVITHTVCIARLPVISPPLADSSMAAVDEENLKEFIDFTYVAKGVIGDHEEQVVRCRCGRG